MLKTLSLLLGNKNMPQITLNYAPFSYQVEFHKAPNRFKVSCGGRRSGKTKASFQELLRYALSHPKSLCWWVAPTYNEAREVGYAEFESYEEQLGPAIKHANKSLMRVTLRNGTQIYFKGADRRDSLRGRGVDFLSIDEVAFLEEDTWKKVLRPALADKNGQAVLTTTPNGKNWFYDFWHLNSRHDRETYKLFRWITEDNPLISDEELQSLKDELSDMDFRQECLAEFVTKAGQVYDDFSEENVIDTYSPSPDKDDIYIGADFGYANPSFFAFMAVNRNNGNVYQFAEISKARTKIQILKDDIIETLAKFHLSPKDVSAINSDPAGNADELTSGESPVDYLRKYFTVLNKASKIAPGVALVRSFIRSRSGKIKYFVTKDCVDTIRALNGYTYASTSKNSRLIKEEPLKDGVHDHGCDAIRYFFVNTFPQNRYVGTVPDTESYLIQRSNKPVMKKCSVCYNAFVSKTPKHSPPFQCPNCQEV